MPALHAEKKTQKDIDVDKIRTCARRTYLMPIFEKIRVKPLNHSGTTSFIVVLIVYTFPICILYKNTLFT